MQYIFKNACPRFEFILLKTKMNEGLCLLVNMYLLNIGNGDSSLTRGMTWRCLLQWGKHGRFAEGIAHAFPYIT
jgi:hypothetical protein